MLENSADSLETWRDEFPILHRSLYMISNSLGAMPRKAARSLADYADTWATRGVRAWEERWWEMAGEVGNKVPLDVTALGVDFASGGCLKWLCGGPGNGFLYTRPDLLRSLAPRFTGWLALAHPFAFEIDAGETREDAVRMMNGTPPIPAYYAAIPGLDALRGRNAGK